MALFSFGHAQVTPREVATWKYMFGWGVVLGLLIGRWGVKR